MYEIIVLRTTYLTDFSDVETALRNKYAEGVCINTFKIEQMVNATFKSSHNNTSVLTPLYFPLLDSFYNAGYSPIVLIGGFKTFEINDIMSKYSDKILSISLYSSDDRILLREKNKHNYTLINTKDLLTKFKSKRTVKYGYKEALTLNKQIFETSNLTSISIDTSLNDANSITNIILSSL